MLRGSAMECLEDAFALGDDNVMTVVMNTWSAFYFTPEERTSYFEEISRRSANGNVAWISMESTMVKWADVEVDEAAHHRAASQVVLMRPSSTPAVVGCRWLRARAVVGANYRFVVRDGSPAEAIWTKSAASKNESLAVEKMRLSSWYVNASGRFWWISVPNLFISL